MGGGDFLYIYLYIYIYFYFSLSPSCVSCSEGGALLEERGKRVVVDEEWLLWSGRMNDVKEVRKEVGED